MKGMTSLTIFILHFSMGCGLGVDENGICNPVIANRRPKLAGLGYTQ